MGYALYAVSRKSTGRKLQYVCNMIMGATLLYIGSTKLSHTEYRGRLFMMENVVISSNVSILIL